MNEAQRNPIGVRYDLLVPEFLEAMAQLMHAGTHYDQVPGEPNWQKGLPGEKSPINHIMDHLINYQMGYSHDHLGNRRYHLAAVALNAMFEFWFELEREEAQFAEMLSSDRELGVVPQPEKTTPPVPQNDNPIAEVAEAAPKLTPYEWFMNKLGVKSTGGAAGDDTSSK